ADEPLGFRVEPLSRPADGPCGALDLFVQIHLATRFETVVIKVNPRPGSNPSQRAVPFSQDHLRAVSSRAVGRHHAGSAAAHYEYFCRDAFHCNPLFLRPGPRPLAIAPAHPNCAGAGPVDSRTDSRGGKTMRTPTRSVFSLAATRCV